MRRRPLRSLARLDLHDALGRYCRERRLTTILTYRMGWYGVQVIFGRGHAFWPVEVHLKPCEALRDPEAVQDALYDRATRAIDRKLKALGWTTPSRRPDSAPRARSPR